mmetsp:Transcript_10721/g.18301  ORF Transcript_10721/g.18301 Transcript_10721/m.18301 type:complete len:272 (+) Transcript_10721:112-927(+)|eukprot:CAMPEP_0171500456 /NCGR_PEP_ID=MMETSP0958-20121227/8998_1 /TAXON_ID=87120 /ORGANISM="Aurantiochytrium limacinum, Strain ATCCMYA-1381" /LENGTH=271 /DNA_ID=CAMNT_0012035133 /DNA_START=69 /DNA_END=884 /DNA_ORIENTATION=+
MTASFAALAIVASMFIAKSDACSFSDNYKNVQCEAWNALADTFQSENWSVCQTARDENPCSSSSCAKTNGFVNCKDGRLRRLEFFEDIGMVYNTSYGIEALSDAFLAASDIKFETLTINNQSGLELTACIPELCSAITCDFTYSGCSGLCTDSGLCPLTDAPTTSSPTTAPTEFPTESPTISTASPTSAPTEMIVTDSPTAAPTEEPGSEITFAPSAARPADCPNATNPDCDTDSPTASPTFSPTDAPSSAGSIQASSLVIVSTLIARMLW